MGLLGAPGAHTLRAEESQDTEGPGQRCTPHLLSTSSPSGLPPMSWRIGAWATEQVTAFQRASSAVEGRNGALAQLHHNQRVTEAAVQGVDRPA